MTEASTRARLLTRIAATAVATIALVIGGAAPAAGAVAKPAASTAAAPAAYNPNGVAISLKSVVGTFDNPVLVTSPRDGSHRLFVVEQTGRVRIISKGAVLATPFMDLHSLISTGGERGRRHS